MMPLRPRKPPVFPDLSDLSLLLSFLTSLPDAARPMFWAPPRPCTRTSLVGLTFFAVDKSSACTDWRLLEGAWKSCVTLFSRDRLSSGGGLKPLLCCNGRVPIRDSKRGFEAYVFARETWRWLDRAWMPSSSDRSSFINVFGSEKACTRRLG